MTDHKAAAEEGEFDRLMRMSLWRRVKVGAFRMWSKRHPANATCDNEDCKYRGRRTRRGRWCPACYDDGGGELVLDVRKA